MKKAIFYFILALGFVGCSDSEPDKPGKDWSTSESTDRVEVTTTYEEGEFDNPQATGLLNELELCGPENPECPFCATCSPRFFRFFDISKSGEFQDLFAIQIKALTIVANEEFALPTREVRVYVRENGALVLANRFKGYIMQTQAGKSKVDDLVIRFFRYIDDEKHFFNCLFQWSVEDKRYKFVEVERIEGKNWGGAVKAADKVETSQQVYSELKEEGMIQ